MSRSRTLIAAFWLSVTPAAFAAAPVHEFTLDNGLKILVREDHRAPVVVSQVWYKVGSSYEPSNLTGISHLLEHMMFKGTPTVPGGEFSRLIAQIHRRQHLHVRKKPPAASASSHRPVATTGPDTGMRTAG